MASRWFAASVLTVLSLTLAPAWAEPGSTERDSGLAELLLPMAGQRPGSVVGVVQGAALVAVQSVGLADLNFGVPFTPDTPTNIGSTAKQFTGYALAHLHVQGRISLDDDIRDYLPELPAFDEVVTLRHLATHTSGYREFLNTLGLAGRRIDKSDWIDPDEAIALIQRQPALQNEPGAEWNYNNTGYVLLARVIEQVTETPFADWMAAEVFAPLKMHDTQVRPAPDVIMAKAARGYSKDGEAWREARDLGGAQGAGGVYTTVGDMARWMQELSSFDHAGPAVAELLTTAFELSNGESTRYGLGLMIDDWRGQTRWQHGGGDLGHASAFYFFPDIQAGLMVFANHHEIPPDLMDQLGDLFLSEHLEVRAETGASVAALVEDAPFEDALFDRYVGRYEMEAMPGFILRFFRDGERYMTQATGQPAFEITPVSAQTFTLDIVNARIVFEQAEDGGVPVLTLFQNGEHRAARLPDDDPVPIDLGQYAGRYFSDELETFYEIQVNDGQLQLSHRRFGPLTLHHERADAFKGGFPVATVDFVRDDSGQISGLRAGNMRARDVQFALIETR